MTTWYRGSGHPGAPVDRNPGAVHRIPASSRPDSRRERLAGAAWQGAWELARRLPEPVAFALAEEAGVLAYRLGRARQERVRNNLSRVLPRERLAEGAREAYRSYARYWVEAFRAADIDPGELDRRTTTGGFEHLDGVLDRGRGAIVLLAHHGSWDIAARWAESHRYHLAVVAEVLRPHAVFAKFVDLRERMGLEVVPLRRGHNVVGRLAEVLEANHIVGLLTDRDLGGSAPVVDFFGEPCRIPTGASVLAHRTGAAILPAALLQQPGRCWHFQVLPPVEPSPEGQRATHREVVAALERLILLSPVQWHAFQPVWLSDLPPERGGAGS